MAIIDSGLGWKCDSDYYVSDAGTLITYPNGTLSKVNAGAAIVGYITNQLGWYCLNIMSTDPDFCELSATNNSCTIFNSRSTVVVDGVQWYFTAMYNNVSSYNAESYMDGYSFYLDEDSSTTDEQRVRALLTAANVEIATKIPTIDYVHSFVEGVEVETATRVKANATNIVTEQQRTTTNTANITKNTNDIAKLDANLTDIMLYMGIYGDDVLGLQVDYVNYIYKRLAAAEGLSAGSDFDRFDMYGGRRRCNVDDTGTILAWYGDSDFKEDGSNGQVMVYQPKFYYFVMPLETEPIGDSVGGLHLRKANYYVSANPHRNFKLHPAFYDRNGNEVDYILLSAYEGSLYDVSEMEYIDDDAQVGDFTVETGDKLCSIANVKPCSGLSQYLTRANSEVIAQNKGENWHSLTIKAASAEQLLMMIEYAALNMQTAIGKGVVNKASGLVNEAELTGTTSSLGNATGMANGTDGLVSVSYRGVENFWGNIWTSIEGVNVWGDGTLRGGQPYICDNYNFTEDTKTGYKPVGFTVSNASNYISAFGYDENYDWLFLPSECANADSSYPVGDYTYTTNSLNGYRISLLGAAWNDGLSAGAFCWALADGAGRRTRVLGARLIYTPDSLGDDVYGLQVDYKNSTFKRLSAASNLTAGANFNNVSPWKDIKRCNLADDGTVNAYYGQSGYTEDGSNGQVMVEIPKFYYKVVPLETEPIGDNVGGYHLRKADYYISPTKHDGFKTHPLFVRPDGTERDKAYISAYEASIYDVSASSYILDDAQIADFTANTGDKLSSIANAKPCSGTSQNLTRMNAEQLAVNRGTGWHSFDIKATSAVQMLFMVEYGTLNSQTAIGKGVVDKKSGTGNEAKLTGQTSFLGNLSGSANGTDGLVSVSYRGIENFWGNIWKPVNGINIYGDGTMRGGVPYICSDYNYAGAKKTDNYISAGFTVTNTNGYISAFGYNEQSDWLFLPSETTDTADSNYPIGDYARFEYNLNGYCNTLLGGDWVDGVDAGVFFVILAYTIAAFNRTIGSRLIYVN